MRDLKERRSAACGEGWTSVTEVATDFLDRVTRGEGASGGRSVCVGAFLLVPLVAAALLPSAALLLLAGGTAAAAAVVQGAEGFRIDRVILSVSSFDLSRGCCCWREAVEEEPLVERERVTLVATVACLEEGADSLAETVEVVAWTSFDSRLASSFARERVMRAPEGRGGAGSATAGSTLHGSGAVLCLRPCLGLAGSLAGAAAGRTAGAASTVSASCDLD